jgi:hypothetical protein
MLAPILPRPTIPSCIDRSLPESSVFCLPWVHFCSRRAHSRLIAEGFRTSAKAERRAPDRSFVFAGAAKTPSPSDAAGRPLGTCGSILRSVRPNSVAFSSIALQIRNAACDHSADSLPVEQHQQKNGWQVNDGRRQQPACDHFGTIEGQPAAQPKKARPSSAAPKNIFALHRREMQKSNRSAPGAMPE